MCANVAEALARHAFRVCVCLRKALLGIQRFELESPPFLQVLPKLRLLVWDCVQHIGQPGGHCALDSSTLVVHEEWTLGRTPYSLITTLHPLGRPLCRFSSRSRLHHDLPGHTQTFSDESGSLVTPSRPLQYLPVLNSLLLSLWCWFWKEFPKFENPTKSAMATAYNVILCEFSAPSHTSRSPSSTQMVIGSLTLDDWLPDCCQTCWFLLTPFSSWRDDSSLGFGSPMEI